VAFRQRLIDGQMDRRLIERTIEVANQSQVFGPRALRAALDSSLLWGAGRVEDTCNLVGHALKKIMRVTTLDTAQTRGVCGTTKFYEPSLAYKRRQRPDIGRGCWPQGSTNCQCPLIF
jgi:hypothetical protein